MSKVNEHLGNSDNTSVFEYVPGETEPYSKRWFNQDVEVPEKRDPVDAGDSDLMAGGLASEGMD
jgi:hypothetical protein